MLQFNYLLNYVCQKLKKLPFGDGESLLFESPSLEKKKIPLHHFLCLQFSPIKGAGNADSCSDLIYVPGVACAV